MLFKHGTGNRRKIYSGVKKCSTAHYRNELRALLAPLAQAAAVDLETPNEAAVDLDASQLVEAALGQISHPGSGA